MSVGLQQTGWAEVAARGQQARRFSAMAPGIGCWGEGRIDVQVTNHIGTKKKARCGAPGFARYREPGSRVPRRQPFREALDHSRALPQSDIRVSKFQPGYKQLRMVCRVVWRAAAHRRLNDGAWWRPWWPSRQSWSWLESWPLQHPQLAWLPCGRFRRHCWLLPQPI